MKVDRRTKITFFCLAALGVIILELWGYYLYQNFLQPQTNEADSAQPQTTESNKSEANEAAEKPTSEEIASLKTEIQKMEEGGIEKSEAGQKKYELLKLCLEYSYTGSNCENSPPEKLTQKAQEYLDLDEWEIKFLCQCNEDQIDQSYQEESGESTSEMEFIEFKHLYKTYLKNLGFSDDEIKQKLDEANELYQSNPEEYQKLKEEVESKL